MTVSIFCEILEWFGAFLKKSIFSLAVAKNEIVKPIINIFEKKVRNVDGMTVPIFCEILEWFGALLKKSIFSMAIANGNLRLRRKNGKIGLLKMHALNCGICPSVAPRMSPKLPADHAVHTF